MNSSLTRRPIARGCVKVRWCGSDGTRPHTRHGCRRTNFRWSCAVEMSAMWHTGHSEETHSPDECARMVVRRNRSRLIGWWRSRAGRGSCGRCPARSTAGHSGRCGQLREGRGCKIENYALNPWRMPMRQVKQPSSIISTKQDNTPNIAERPEPSGYCRLHEGKFERH
jgi:hypothetical protein